MFYFLNLTINALTVRRQKTIKLYLILWQMTIFMILRKLLTKLSFTTVSLNIKFIN